MVLTIIGEFRRAGLFPMRIEDPAAIGADVLGRHAADGQAQEAGGFLFDANPFTREQLLVVAEPDL